MEILRLKFVQDLNFKSSINQVFKVKLSKNNDQNRLTTHDLINFKVLFIEFRKQKKSKT